MSRAGKETERTPTFSVFCLTCLSEGKENTIVFKGAVTLGIDLEPRPLVAYHRSDNSGTLP